MSRPPTSSASPCSTTQQVRDVVGELGRARQAGHRHRHPLDDRARTTADRTRRCSCGPRAFTSSTRRSAVARARPTRVSSPSWSAPTARSTSASSRCSSSGRRMVVRAGEPGAGTRMKLARNMLTFIGFAAACEAMKLAEAGGYRAADSSAGWCGTAMRRAAGPARSSSATTRTPLPPDHFLYGMFAHARGLGEKDLQPGARAWRGHRCRPAAGRDRAARTWPPDSACRTRIDDEGVAMDELSQEGPREDERGLRLGDAGHRGRRTSTSPSTTSSAPSGPGPGCRCATSG